jgi:hypothetical protein
MRYVATAGGKPFREFKVMRLGQVLWLICQPYRNMLEDSVDFEDCAVWKGDQLVATVRARPGVVGLEVARLGRARVPDGVTYDNEAA